MYVRIRRQDARMSGNAGAPLKGSEHEANEVQPTLKTIWIFSL